MHSSLSIAIARLLLTGTTASTEPARPNIRFILADDLRWRDTTPIGPSDYHETPNIERPRAHGMLFTNAPTASPIYAPTRAGIITGRYSGRYGLTQARGGSGQPTFVNRLATDTRPTDRAIQLETATRLPTTARTLAEALHDAGYRTGHFGTSHLGKEGFGPLNQGLKIAAPSKPSGMIDRSYFAPRGLLAEAACECPATPGEHDEEAIAFIERHAGSGRSFFLNYGAFSIHSPWLADSELVARIAGRDPSRKAQRNPFYAAMVTSFDEAVGRLLDALDQRHITDRTIVVLSSDHDGNTRAPPRTKPAGYERIPGTHIDAISQVLALPSADGPCREFFTYCPRQGGDVSVSPTLDGRIDAFLHELGQSVPQAQPSYRKRHLQ